MFICLKFLATVIGGALMLVAALTLSDKALTPIPRPPEANPADRRLACENENLRAALLSQQEDTARVCAEARAWKLAYEALMRTAVLVPQRGVEVPDADLIPATKLPTKPEGK